MLVLSRNKNQRVAMMQDDKVIVWLTVVDFSRGKVKLGFEADRKIEFVREEILGRASAPVEPIKEEQNGPGQDAPIKRIAP